MGQWVISGCPLRGMAWNTLKYGEIFVIGIKRRTCAFSDIRKAEGMPFLPLPAQCANGHLSNMDTASATATAFMDEVVFRFTLRCDEDGIRCARRDGAGTA